MLNRSLSFHFIGTLGINPGIKTIWEDEIQRRKNRGESSVITPPPSQGNILSINALLYTFLCCYRPLCCFLYFRTRSDL